MIFRDRTEAGRLLAEALRQYGDQACVVLALPRGGVPVAAEIARVLKAPLDLIIVRKIGVPAQPELAMGAVVDTDPPFTLANDDVLATAGVSLTEFAAIRSEELAEARRRRAKYLAGRLPVSLKHATAILVDDGIATGTTMRAALKALHGTGQSASSWRLLSHLPKSLRNCAGRLTMWCALKLRQPWTRLAASTKTSTK